MLLKIQATNEKIPRPSWGTRPPAHCLFIMKFELLSDKQLEAIKGGLNDRIFNLNPQLNAGGAFATRGGRARVSQDNTALAVNVIV